MKKEKKYDILTITKTAAVIAIVLLLGMTPVGYIPIGSLQVTTVHIVVIIIAIILGLKQGLIAGLVFGVSSILTALMQSGLFAPIFLNPLVSIVPRLALPVIAYFLFRIFYGILKNRVSNMLALTISAIISAIVSTLAHSIMVIALIWVFRWMSGGLTDQVLLPIIIGLLTVNVPLEILFAVIGVGFIVPILYPWFNKDKVEQESSSVPEKAAPQKKQKKKDK